MPVGIRLIAVTLAVALALFGHTVSAPAGEATSTTRILTSPPRVLASVVPGGTSTATLLVMNQSRSSASLLVRAADLEPDPDGEAFGVIADVGDAPRGAGAWLTIDRPTITLGPGERANVKVTIRVPQDADAGGHYGALVVETAPAGTGTTGAPVSVQLRLVTHVSVLVPGDVDYDGSFSDVHARRTDDGQLDVRARYRNTGNIQSTPTDVALRVSGPTGARSVELEIPETMPGGSRRLQRSVGLPSPAGTFDARLRMRLEDGSIVRSRRVSVFAWQGWVPWAVGGTFVLFVAIGLGIPWLRRRRELQRYIREELEAMDRVDESDEEPTEDTGNGTVLRLKHRDEGSDR